MRLPKGLHQSVFLDENIIMIETLKSYSLPKDRTMSTRLFCKAQQAEELVCELAGEVKSPSEKLSNGLMHQNSKASLFTMTYFFSHCYTIQIHVSKYVSPEHFFRSNLYLHVISQKNLFENLSNANLINNVQLYLGEYLKTKRIRVKSF